MDSHRGVVIISATLNGDGIEDALHVNEYHNVFWFKSSGLEIGDHTLEVIAQDAAGNRHPTAQKATITIVERKPYSLKLNPGWNLVSIPGEPEDSDIYSVVPADRSDITSVLTYDSAAARWRSAVRGADGLFMGTLKTFSAKRAYWIETSSFMALKVSIPKSSAGAVALPPTIELAAGWNMVPILEADGDFLLDDDAKLPVSTYFAGFGAARAYTFNTISNRWTQVDEVEIGKAYWVRVNEAGVLAP